MAESRFQRFRELPALMPGKMDVFFADPRKIMVDPDYNCRDMNSAETIAHIDWLTEEIGSQGFNPELPLTVRRRGDDVVLVRGHCRLAACLKLIKSGVELPRIPVMQIAAGTSDIDLLFDQESSNNGLRLDPLARARLVFKARKMGIDDAEIARRMHWKTTKSIHEHLAMLEMPEDLKQDVRDGKVAPTVALGAIREHGEDFAKKLIQENLEENRRIKGKRERATPKGIKQAAERLRPKPEPKPEPVSASRQDVESDSNPGPDRTQAAAFAGNGTHEYTPPAEAPAAPEPLPTDAAPSPQAAPDGPQPEAAPPSHSVDEAAPAAEPSHEAATAPAAPKPLTHLTNGSFFKAAEPIHEAIVEQANLEEFADDDRVGVTFAVSDLKRFSAAVNTARGVS